MAKKVKLTRPELKRQRDMMQRFQRYLPMLKLKQQQLQSTMRDLLKTRKKALGEQKQAEDKFAPFRHILVDQTGINVVALSTPENINTSNRNIAGVNIPVFEGIDYPDVSYSLFSTPAWVDKTLAELRNISKLKAIVEILEKQYELLDRELTKVIQRVNLFEKVMIPRCKDAIRVIRIKLGDEMTAAVGRAKIAKGKIDAEEEVIKEAVMEEEAAAGGMLA